MSILNKVMMIGNVVADPSVRQTAGGTAVAEICLALDAAGGPSKQGEGAQDPAFVDVILWDKMADNAGKYLRKGNPVLIEGRLQQDTWEDRATGQKRRKLKVVGERMRFLSAPRTEEAQPRREVERRTAG
jgi:single-strand DNA-binding protein